MKLVRIILLICAFLILNVAEINAATLTVDTTSDDAALTACAAAAGDCSLRGAIAAAASGDTVTFDAGLFFSPRLIRLTNGELSINKNLTVAGVGGVIVDANNASRVFNVSAGVTVGLSEMTIQSGSASNGGGGIRNSGGLTLTNVIVTRSNSGQSSFGGGIFNNGTLNVVNSTICDNGADVAGGGIFNDTAGTVNITGSTVVGNATSNGASGGGGIESTGSLTITNSAIVANTASTGGGVDTSNNTTITNSTISDNRGNNGCGGLRGRGTLTNVTIANNSTAGGGGGLCLGNGAVVRNSIVAGNTAGTNPDINGTFTSQGNNLVQNRGSSAGYVSSDLPNGTDPQLAPLTNNRGLSATRALPVGSPAVDAGNNSLATGTTDQRGAGFARVAGSAIDIGAFERQATTAALATVGGRVLTESGRGVYNAQVMITNTQAGVCFANTNPFGFYRFQGVPAGETYIFNVRAKRFSFLPQVINVLEEMNDLNFTAQPNP